MDLAYNNVILFIQKLGTIFADRRFQISLGVLLFVVFGVPEGKYTAELETVSALLLNLALVLSWTNRPPSGLKFKELVDLEVITKVANVINSNYEK